MFTKLSGFAVSILGILLFSCAAVGQVTTGTILGTVHDSTGAVVPEATITISDTTKGTVSQYKTDASGDYNVQFLIPGTYNVSVQKTGFKRSVSNNVVLDVDQHARVDFVMEVGQVSDTVEVTASAPLIRLDSAEMGEVVGKRQVQALPLNGRNFAQLVYLVPGVTPGQASENLSGSSSFNPRAASDFNALGSQANANAWIVDGIDDNEWTFNTVMIQPSVESIAEFKVLTGTYAAEFGRGAGVVSVSTRSGSNDFHGEAFDYLRNSWMDARNYFNPIGTAQPAYRRNQFGAAVGGRIIKDKLFFFADYYGQRSLKGIVNQNSVPTAAERVGDFSQYTTPANKLIPIYNPFTTRTVVTPKGTVVARDPFPGNIIPQNLLSQVGLNVASIFPLPQKAGSFNNYTSAANQIIDDNGGNGRIDYRISDKDSAFGRFSYERFIQTAPNPLVGGQGTCCLATPASAAKQFDLGPQVAGVQDTTLIAQGLSLNETHIFNAGLLNEFRTGYARTNPFTFQSDYGHQSATSLGIQGVNVTQYATGLPNIQIGSNCTGSEFTCLQGGQAFLPASPVQTNIQLEDTLSWTRGAHQLKFGFRYIKQMSSPFTNTTTRGQFTFNDNFTNDPQNVTGTGSGLAALLLGFPNSGSRNYLQQPYFVTDGEWAGFAQDDWKASSRLTLNLGIRYEVYTPEVARHNVLANFNYKTLSFIYAGQNGVDRHAGMQTRYGDLGPRLGFAYDVGGNGTTVIRGGYGISFFPLPYSGSDELGQNPPYTVSQTFNENTNPTASQFQNPCTGGNLGSNCLIAINNPFPQGVTTIPVSVTTNTALLNAAAPAIVSHQLSNPTPSVQSYNLDIERQLGTGLIEIAYAGSHSIHLTFAYNPNEVQPGTPGVNNAGSTASRRLIQPLNNISTWVQEDEINASNYNSLQVKFTERYSHGLTALVAYTYSKSLDYGGSAASGGGSAGNPQTVTCLKCGYGASGFDQKHRFVTSAAYELPFGAGKSFATHGPAAWALGGWEVDGIVTVATGNPFTVTLNTGVNFGAPSWPNRVGKGTLSNPKQSRWFDTTAFIAPPPNTYGNSARSVLYGPGIANADLSLQRTIRLRESLSLALRGDAFNSFNHPNFLNPNSSIGAGTASVITGTNLDNRDMQVSAKIVF